MIKKNLLKLVNAVRMGLCVCRSHWFSLAHFYAKYLLVCLLFFCNVLLVVSVQLCDGCTMFSVKATIQKCKMCKQQMKYCQQSSGRQLNMHLFSYWMYIQKSTSDFNSCTFTIKPLGVSKALTSASV